MLRQHKMAKIMTSHLLDFEIIFSQIIEVKLHFNHFLHICSKNKNCNSQSEGKQRNHETWCLVSLYGSKFHTLQDTECKFWSEIWILLEKLLIDSLHGFSTKVAVHFQKKVICRLCSNCTMIIVFTNIFSTYFWTKSWRKIELFVSLSSKLKYFDPW